MGKSAEDEKKRLIERHEMNAITDGNGICACVQLICCRLRAYILTEARAFPISSPELLVVVLRLAVVGETTNCYQHDLCTQKLGWLNPNVPS